MKGRYFGLSILLGLVVAIAGSVEDIIAREQLRALEQKSVHASEIRASASATARVRVVVQLAIPPGAASLGTVSEDLSAVQSAVRSEVDQVLRANIGSAALQTAELGLTRADAHPIFSLNATLAEIERLAADSRVINIHLDLQLRPMLSESLPIIGMPSVYDNYNATGSNRAVVIFDTGVQTSHPWFTGILVGEGCFSGGGNKSNSNCPGGALSNTDPGSSVNCNGAGCDHGTHVAGTAVGRNNFGSNPPNGVAKSAKLIAYQIFSKDGSAKWSDITNALSNFYLRRNTFGVPIDAVNLSIGTEETFVGNCDIGLSSLKTIIDNLRDAGIGIATALSAGNQGQSLTEGARNGVSAPGCISTAITVSNTNDNNQVSQTSNIGSETDLHAPGTNIYAPVTESSFGTKTGTSQAAPHVAGAIAAIRSVCVSKTIAEIETALKASPHLVADTRSGGVWQKPLMRVDDAIQRLGCVPPVVPRLASLAPVSGSVATEAYAISSGGDFVVGNSCVAPTVCGAHVPTLWKQGSPTPLIMTGYVDATAYGVSVDGSVVAGAARAAGFRVPVRWIFGQLSELRDSNGSPGPGEVRAVSANGRTVVGFSGIGNNVNALYWTNDSVVAVSLKSEGNSWASGVSGDGSIIVGQHKRRPAMWTNTGQNRFDLPLLQNHTEGNAIAISEDGRVIVGYSTGTNGVRVAVLWINRQIQAIEPHQTASDSLATAVSKDGKVVVGSRRGAAFRWTLTSGIYDLYTLLRGANIDVSGRDLHDGFAVSGDGTRIVVRGSRLLPQQVFTGFLVDLPVQ